jgi:hypothetical protein
MGSNAGEDHDPREHGLAHVMFPPREWPDGLPPPHFFPLA